MHWILNQSYDELANDTIVWNWRVVDDKLQSISAGDKLNGGTILLGGECFELVLGDGTVLKSSDFKLLPTPTISSPGFGIQIMNLKHDLRG